MKFLQRQRTATVTTAIAITMAAASTFLPQVAQAQTFSEEFDAPLNQAKWYTYNNVNPKGRTFYGNTETLLNQNGVSFARLQMDTWNGDHPGFFKGTVLASFYKFAGGTFEARMRVPQAQVGTVYAFFPYSKSAANPDVGDEIDFEILGNYAARKYMWLNTFNDGVSAQSQGFYPPTLLNIDTFANWHIFKAVANGTYVNWYVDGVLVKTLSGSPAVPTFDRLAPFLEVWAPAGSPNPFGGYFPEAYDARLMPATSPAGNTTTYLDVDWVRIYQGVYDSGATASRPASDSANLDNSASLTAQDGSIKAPAGTVLSQVEVVPGFKSRIRLVFSGKLTSKTATLASNYLLSIDGVQAQSTNVQLEDANIVTIDLDRPFAAGNTVTVAAYNLIDANGKMLEDQIKTVGVSALS